MEFIANLEASRTNEGITPENLIKIEKRFHDVVGDKNEVDLEGFKKIVQSKNMFFVERIFDVFDSDKSGTVSLDEFMYVLHKLANQSPVEKLRYLFDVYDLNNDGNIEFCELRNVISECIKENGLKFEEEETDELTRMLFEDADSDGNGVISFNEFQNQLERQPAFIDNLTQSLEKCLLPPSSNTHKESSLKSMFKRKVNLQRIRNNWTSVAFFLVYFLINTILFIERSFQYAENNVYVIVARACGQCLNFNCAFVVVPVLRKSMTWLRTNGYSQYFPIDQHLYYHKLIGCVIYFYSVLHTIMHVINFSVTSEELGAPLSELLISTQMKIGWVGGSACLTGWILLIVLTIMCISAMPFVRRSGNFEVFFCLHLLFSVFWICLIMHAPSFWKWFIGPGIIFFIEASIRLHRSMFSNKAAYVQQGVLLPSQVTHLVIKRPPKFDYKPGDHVYINIPTIAKFEWHPFTISSAPELDDVIWLHIRGIGQWTNGLYNYFKKEDREAILSDKLTQNMEMAPHFIWNETVSSPGSGLYSEPVESSAGALNNGIFSKPVESPAEGISNKNISLLSIRKTHCNDSTFRRGVLDIDGVNNSMRLNNNSSSVHRRTLEECFFNSAYNEDDVLNETIIELESGNRNDSVSTMKDSEESSLASDQLIPRYRRTSLASTSGSLAIQRKNKEDMRSMLAENVTGYGDIGTSKKSSRMFSKERRKSVRVSVAKYGLNKCQTVIVMPTVTEEDEEECENDLDMENIEEDLKLEGDLENVIVMQQPLKIYLDGPYGSPSRHIFQSRHAVLIGTGIGVTPFASILQSIMYQYKKSRHTCPSCNHKWPDPIQVSNIHLKKVDFFWLNRYQRSFEWFVNLLSELEVEQAQLQEKDRFLDIHMYITSALHPADMKAVGLQMALDLLYKKEKRCLITGLKSRTKPGRPDWNKVFTSIAQQQKGKVTLFFCGPNQLAKTLQSKCDEFGFRFRKEIF